MRSGVLTVCCIATIKEIKLPGREAAAVERPACRQAWRAVPLSVSLLVAKQDLFDGIDRPEVTPLISTVFYLRYPDATMIALDDPALAQDDGAIAVIHRILGTTRCSRKKAADTPLAMCPPQFVTHERHGVNALLHVALVIVSLEP